MTRHDAGQQAIPEPNTVDLHVGARIRRRRIQLHLSQEKVAAGLGLSFQQLKKYEHGTNRIGASRLFHLSQILTVTVQYFFDEMPGAVASTVMSLDGTPDGRTEQAQVLALLETPEGLELNRAFQRIAKTSVRRSIIGVVSALARADEPAAAAG